MWCINSIEHISVQVQPFFFAKPNIVKEKYPASKTVKDL
jgi:hypothetical protein